MKLLVSALEPSANIYLQDILKSYHDDLEIVGIFDEKLGEPIYKASDFAVMGLTEVIDKVGLAKLAIGEMIFLAKDVDKVLLIDSPAFNLPLAKSLKLNYPDLEIIYYILPKVWAWKKGRAKKVDKYCDRLCSIFPFEDRFYKRSEYVGNPLLDSINVKNDGKIKNQIAFMPGSRKGEIKRLMPIFRELAKDINKKKVLVIPKLFTDEQIQEYYGDISDFEVSFDAHTTLANSDFAYICSGTATLEAAIIGTPFVLVYKARKLDFWIGRKLVKLPYVGLANILLDFEGREPLHQEFLQDDVTFDNLIDAYHDIDEEKFLKRSQEIVDILKFGSKDRVIEIIKG
jgi:lipid-A-disaccharide synthase